MHSLAATYSKHSLLKIQVLLTYTLAMHTLAGYKAGHMAQQYNQSDASRLLHIAAHRAHQGM